jgi:hypothetical protein
MMLSNRMLSLSMPASRVWSSLVVLTVVSLFGEIACRTLARGGDQERLLQLASEGVSKLPANIGPWRMLKSEPMDDAALSMLKCRAHQSRVYADDQTGDAISLVLLAGVSGPIVAHTPESCYSSTDFEVVESAKSEVIRQTGDRADTFGNIAFRSKSLTAQRQEVYYAWRRHDGPWEAPQSPRLALGGQPMLYKLQLAIACPSTSSDKSYADDAMHRFLNDLLPTLDDILTDK